MGEWSTGKNLVGKLVDVIRLDGEIAGQDIPHRLNLKAEGIAGLPLFYADGDVVGVGEQSILGDFPVDARVRQNPDLVLKQGDEEKHPGVVAGGMEVFLIKGAERPFGYPGLQAAVGDEQPEKRGQDFDQAVDPDYPGDHERQEMAEAVGQKKVGDKEGGQTADSEACQERGLGIGVAGGNHHGDNLAGGFFLHPGDGRGDLLIFRLGKKGLCFHHLPAPRGAAASKSAPAKTAKAATSPITKAATA